MEENRIVLVLLIGLPGSGKSTLVRSLCSRYPGLVAISTDGIREQLFGHEAIQGPWGLIWQELEGQLRRAVGDIRQQRAIAALYDATNVERRQRREAINLGRSVGFTWIVGVWLDTPLDVCLVRNQQRDRQVPEAIIERMQRKLMGAPPTLADGLDELWQDSSDEPEPLLHRLLDLLARSLEREHL